MYLDVLVIFKHYCPQYISLIWLQWRHCLPLCLCELSIVWKGWCNEHLVIWTPLNPRLDSEQAAHVPPGSGRSTGPIWAHLSCHSEPQPSSEAWCSARPPHGGRPLSELYLLLHHSLALNLLFLMLAFCHPHQLSSSLFLFLGWLPSWFVMLLRARIYSWWGHVW